MSKRMARAGLGGFVVVGIFWTLIWLPALLLDDLSENSKLDALVGSVLGLSMLSLGLWSIWSMGRKP